MTTYAIFRLMWLPFTTFIRTWQLMVTTFRWPWRPMVKTLWRPWRLVVKTLWRPLLRLTTTLWLSRMTSLMTHVMTLMTSIVRIHCPHDWDQVTKRMTRWWQGWLTTPTEDVANLVWRPMWLLLTTHDDRSDDQNPTPTTLTTLGDLPWTIHVTTCWRPWNFFDDIWWLNLAIFITKVESCLSCRGVMWPRNTNNVSQNWTFYWVPAIIHFSPKRPNSQFQMSDLEWVWNRFRMTFLTKIP
jgi:hypothetical protein